MTRLKGMWRPLLSWYGRNRRDLPWRVAGEPAGQRIDPYAVLVSEFMLQQTQVATVVPYFQRFMHAFPGIRNLADADEQDVLRLWQGLGYYSRARNLHATARRIAMEFDGRVPDSCGQLLTLPGVGRYTAGAVASIAFEKRAPILDGNVARVLCRLEAIQTDPRDRKTLEKLWKLAEEILPNRRIGDFNSALMELGATVCIPKNPACLVCPLRSMCRAQQMGLQQLIPPPRKRPPNPEHVRWTICVSRGNRWLIERRPHTGRWAGLWQFPTLEASADQPRRAHIAKSLGVRVGELKPVGQVRHALTHRNYVFNVFTAKGNAAGGSGALRKWVRLKELNEYPLSRPQIKIAEILSELPGPPT
jgi:A/G-specific adenine glycosylase